MENDNEEVEQDDTEDTENVDWFGEPSNFW